MKAPVSRLERVYVKVTSDFDTTGYLCPRAICWGDGRSFAIEAVKDFRPAAATDGPTGRDCYTVLIRGNERLLYFERTDPRFCGRVGRWYVLRPAGPAGEAPHA